MSDETLRDLERRAREEPTDLAAGLAYARALERAGDAWGVHLQRVRLARLGDAGAIAALAAPAPPSVRAPRSIQTARLEDQAWLLGTTRSEVLLSPARGAIAALSTADLRELWSQRVERRGHPARVVGPCLVHADGEALAVREAATGELRYRLRLPGRPTTLAVAGLHAVVACSGLRETVVGVSLGTTSGEIAWRDRDRKKAFARSIVVARGEAFVAFQDHPRRSARFLVALDVETGAPRGGEIPIDFGAVQAHDETGAVVASSGASVNEVEHLTYLDFATRARPWRIDATYDVELAHDIALTSDTVYVLRGGAGLALVAHRRADGRALWSTRVEGAHAHRALLLAGDLLYALTPGRGSLQAFERADGTRIFEHPLYGPHGDLESVALAPAGEGILVLKATHERTDLWLLRD